MIRALYVLCFCNHVGWYFAPYRSTGKRFFSQLSSCNAKRVRTKICYLTKLNAQCRFNRLNAQETVGMNFEHFVSTLLSCHCTRSLVIDQISKQKKASQLFDVTLVVTLFDMMTKPVSTTLTQSIKADVHRIVSLVYIGTG